MQLNELKDEGKEKPSRLMTILGPNPYRWSPRSCPNSHPIIDRVISPISSEYQERILRDIMEDSLGG